MYPRRAHCHTHSFGPSSGAKALPIPMYPWRTHRHTRSFGLSSKAETLHIPMYSQTAQSIARQTRRHHKKPAFGQTSRGNLNLHPPENHSRQIFNLRFSCLLPQCSTYTYLFLYVLTESLLHLLLSLIFRHMHLNLINVRSTYAS